MLCLQAIHPFLNLDRSETFTESKITMCQDSSRVRQILIAQRQQKLWERLQQAGLQPAGATQRAAHASREAVDGKEQDIHTRSPASSSHSSGHVLRDEEPESSKVLFTCWCFPLLLPPAPHQSPRSRPRPCGTGPLPAQARGALPADHAGALWPPPRRLCGCRGLYGSPVFHADELHPSSLQAAEERRWLRATMQRTPLSPVL